MPTQIFLLTEHPYHDGTRMLGVFSTAEKAREALKIHRPSLHAHGWSRLVDKWADDQSDGLYDSVIFPSAEEDDIAIHRYTVDVAQDPHFLQSVG